MNNWRLGMLWIFSWLVGVVLPSVGYSQKLKNSFEFTIQPYQGVYRVYAKTGDRKPVAKNTKLQVVLLSRNYHVDKSKVSSELVIKSGTNSGSVDLALPTYSANRWRQENILIEDNDNGFEDSQDFLSQPFDRSTSWQQLDHFLFVSSNISSVPGRRFIANRKTQMAMNMDSLGVKDPATLPAFQTLAMYYEASQIINANSVPSSLSFLQNVGEYFQCIDTQDFFEQWKCLCGFKSVLISWPDLQKIAQSKSKLDALKNWVAAGGHLCVFDCGKDLTNRVKVMQELTGKKLDWKWSVPSSDLKQLNGFIARNSYSNQGNVLLDVNSLRKPATNVVESVTGQAVIQTDLLHGKLVLIEDDMTGWKTSDWEMLYNMSYSHQGVEQKFGVSSMGRKYDPSFRIPGIGDPPVLAFQVLITLFVLMVGPVFYIVFQRSGRLYLLLVAVPLLALAAVISLVGYATINDGFAIQGRVNSLTRIDHRYDLATQHTRRSYYAGIAPGQFVYDDETLVFDTRHRYAPVSQFKIRNEKSLISGGQIRARSPFQLTSLDCLEIDKGVTFSRSSSDAESGTVSNPFAFALEAVVFRVGDKLYFAKDVAPESTSSATISTTSECVKEVSKISRDLDQGQLFKKSSNWGDVEKVTKNLISRQFKYEVPENGYLAISATNSLNDDPKNSAIYEGNQLHVIIGQW